MTIIKIKYIYVILKRLIEGIMRLLVKIFSKFTFLFISMLFVVVFYLPTNVWAENDKDLGKFKDWQSHSYNENGGLVCNMWSRPQKHAEGGKKRGDIYIYVTHRKKLRRFHEISIDMGYPLKTGSDVIIKVGANKFKLFIKGQSAFGRSKDDRKIIKAMRAGNNMVISGISIKGTKTTDNYSLSGFSKANNAINKKCKVARVK